MCKTDQMKHLLTAIACCLAVAGSAQTPYNPDSDGNNLMGAEDLMSLLSLYGGEFYPNNAPVFQTCNDEYTDTCFVDEATDVVFLDGADFIFLPEDSSFKKITFMPYEFIPYEVNLLMPIVWLTSSDSILWVTYWAHAGSILRSPTNRWYAQ